MNNMTSSIADFFQGNPFSTQIGQSIERSTESTLPTEDWAQYMDICDQINMAEDGPRDAIRAIRRRFNNSVGKNNLTAMYTLTVLETCVKNCHRRFHLLVAAREFLQDLVRVVGPQTEVPKLIQDKVLILIQVWADTFRDDPDLREISKMYEELRAKGVEFPMTDVDTIVPIKTPKPAVDFQRQPSGGQTVQVAQLQQSYQPATLVAPAVVQGSEPSGSQRPVGSFMENQMTKLHRELDVVRTNVCVFNELLTEHSSSKDIPLDALQLMTDLEYTCGQMQSRLVKLLGNLESEEDDASAALVVSLLQVNDDLNSAILRYQRFQRNRDPRQTATQEAPGGDLMDFTSPANPTDSPRNTSMSAQLAALSVQPTEGASRRSPVADMYAAQEESSGFSAGLNSHRIGQKSPEKKPLIEGIPDSKEDLDEMEAWMTKHEGATGGATLPVSSSEFDEFLAERSEGASSINGDPGQPRNRRKMKEDDKEDAMFAL